MKGKRAAFLFTEGVEQSDNVAISSASVA